MTLSINLLYDLQELKASLSIYESLTADVYHKPYLAIRQHDLGGVDYSATALKVSEEDLKELVNQNVINSTDRYRSYLEK